MADTELAPEVPANDAAPVETPKVETEPKAESSPAPEPSEVEKVKASIEKMQKRIDRLTWEKNEARRELEASRARPESKTPANETLTPPTLEQFEFDQSKYAAALTDYLDKLADSKVKTVLEQKEAEKRAQDNRTQFQKRQDEFIKTKPDYREKVLSNPELPITAEMAQVIAESELGPEVAYYLAENEEKAAEIAQLSPFQQARELGRIEAAIEASKKAPVPPKPTAAPPPAPKIEATEPAIEKDPSQMTDAEFRKWRLASIAKHRRRVT